MLSPRHASLLSALLAVLLARVNSQLTGATCQAGFEWMTNSKSQSPCLVAAYLDSVCNADPSSAYIQALSPGDHYTLPTTAASPCFCNTVFYSVIGACAYCQGDQNSPWATWSFNCSQTYTNGFPENIPAGTAIPAWAYQDVLTTGNFSLTAASASAALHSPDSTASAPPSSTAASATSPASSLTSPSLTPTSGTSSSTIVIVTVSSSPSPSKKSDTGAIVGGVVGGIGGLAVILVALFFLLKSRRSSHRPPSAAFTNVTQNPPPPAEPAPWSPQEQEKFMSTTPPVPEMTKVYNPDDPSTFPTAQAMSDTATGTTRNSAYDARYQPNAFQPSRYNGIAEV